MSKALILYASQKGSTAEVARFLADMLREAGHQADIANAEGFQEDIQSYDAIILGSGIYKGMWLHALLSTVSHFSEAIGNKPIWGFALCIRVLETAGEDYARQFYLPTNLLERLNVQEYRFFAGKLHDLSLQEKMTLTERYDGEYRHREGDYRDWDEIRAWGKKIAQKLETINIG